MLGVFSGPDFFKISLKKQTSIRKCQNLQNPQGISTMARRFSETGFIFPGKKKIIFNLAVKFMSKAKERIMSYRKINIDYVMTLALVNTKQERLLKKKKTNA